MSGLCVRDSVLGRPPRVAAGVTVLWISGCSASPSQNILGSYFPSWMLCLGLGVLAAVLCRFLLGLVGFNEAIPLQLLTYMALALAVTLLVWLMFFGQ